MGSSFAFRCAGNALFAIEVAMAMIQCHYIKISGDQCIETPKLSNTPLDKLQLPSNLQAVIATRFDGLTMRQQQLTKIASVIGKVFTFDQLQVCCTESRAIDYDPSEHPNLASLIAEELDALQAVHILKTRQTETGVVVYDFTHILLQEMAYKMLTHVLRQLLHRAIASDLLSKSEVTMNLASVATHYQKAHEFGKALDFWQKAGDQV
jgi:predicted ATPase